MSEDFAIVQHQGKMQSVNGYSKAENSILEVLREPLMSCPVGLCTTTTLLYPSDNTDQYVI